jgi:LEA14-like dessication related protein
MNHLINISFRSENNSAIQQKTSNKYFSREKFKVIMRNRKSMQTIQRLIERGEKDK